MRAGREAGDLDRVVARGQIREEVVAAAVGDHAADRVVGGAEDAVGTDVDLGGVRRHGAVGIRNQTMSAENDERLNRSKRR